VTRRSGAGESGNTARFGFLLFEKRCGKGIPVAGIVLIKPEANSSIFLKGFDNHPGTFDRANTHNVAGFEFRHVQASLFIFIMADRRYTSICGLMTVMRQFFAVAILRRRNANVVGRPILRKGQMQRHLAEDRVFPDLLVSI
jgi:hypothetical protein